MKQNISLWIGGRRTDLNDDSLIQFNYLQSDLDNPTVVRNNYSQTVVLPATDTNNRIFSEYFRPDRMTGTGFNPMRRTPFLIYDDKRILLESGYIRLDDVKRKDGGIYSYSISLFGGLGGFFYSLLYQDDEGTPRSLGSLTYTDKDGGRFIPDETVIEDFGHVYVERCWNYLRGVSPATIPWSNVINFAPCYNGIPDDFDGKKVLVGSGQFSGVSGMSPTVPGTTIPLPFMIECANGHDEWEMRDLRFYLQRPVVSVEAFIDAVAVPGYSFTVTDDVKARLQELWVTLPMMKRPRYQTNGDVVDYNMSDFFVGGITPGDLLIGLAKSFGLVFLCRNYDVRLMTRGEFYSGGRTVDLSERIDLSREMQIKPFAFASKWYVFQNDAVGGLAKANKEQFNKTYGEQKINTGYEFNAEQKNVLEGLKLKSGGMISETSPAMAAYAGTNNYFAPAFAERCTYRSYETASDPTEHEIKYANNPVGNIRSYGGLSGELYRDFAPKVQLAGDDNKPEDGSGVLLWHQGAYKLPTDVPHMQWHLSSDDRRAFNTLNNGVPCWDMREGADYTYTRLTYIPLFTRKWNGRTLEFGIPMLQDTATGSWDNVSGLYRSFWRDYFADRMDKDTKVLRCHVNMLGMDVSQELLRNVYFFANSLWALNKIENYVFGESGPTQWELVKIQDTTNYKN